LEGDFNQRFFSKALKKGYQYFAKFCLLTGNQKTELHLFLVFEKSGSGSEPMRQKQRLGRIFREPIGRSFENFSGVGELIKNMGCW